MAGKPRRNKREVILGKIESINTKITTAEERLSKLQEEKNTLETELKEFDEAEKKAKEEAAMKELLAMMQEKNVSIEDLKGLIG